MNVNLSEGNYKIFTMLGKQKKSGDGGKALKLKLNPSPIYIFGVDTLSIDKIKQ